MPAVEGLREKMRAHSLQVKASTSHSITVRKQSSVSARALRTDSRNAQMLLLKPTGRFPVGVQDLKYCTAESPSSIAADNHVVARLFYPSKPAGLLQRPLTWIRAYQYAQGYVSWGFRNPSTTKEKLLKTLAQNTIYSLGLTKWIPASYNATPEAGYGKFPVIIFSHGAASMRNTYSILCTEFASRGFVVAAVEHADGSACCAELATGEYMLLKGLGTGAALEAKCEYRVQECLTLAQVLQALNTGTSIPGLSLSSWSSSSSSSSSTTSSSKETPTTSSSSTTTTSSNSSSNSSQPQPQPQTFSSLLDMNRLAVMGHSCGGATAAAAVAAHAEFKCGVALDPWWPMLPRDSAALKGWKTNSPLLVLGSQDWNTPGKMWCDGPRQESVFQACLPTAAAAAASQPSARMPVVAGAAVGSSGGSSSSSGGGAVHIVPSGSGHGSFTDLPFLLPHWATTTLRKLSGAKTAPAPPVDPAVVQDVITWSSHIFLTDHLPLPADAVSSLQQFDSWRQQQHNSSSSKKPEDLATSAAAAAAAAAPFGAIEITEDQADSLVDHLTADENLILADESAARSDLRSASNVTGSDLRSHTADHDLALEQASSAELSAAAEGMHIPVRATEEAVYKERVGGDAYLIKLYTQ